MCEESELIDKQIVSFLNHQQENKSLITKMQCHFVHAFSIKVVEEKQVITFAILNRIYHA